MPSPTRSNGNCRKARRDSFPAAIGWYGAEAQIAHPDHIVTAEEFAKLPLIEPIYPLTEGFPARSCHGRIREALGKLPEMPEWQDAAYRQRHNWPDFTVALRAMHHPETVAALGPDSVARKRLAYDELLANQLALCLVEPT